jgi:hypothetical protein
MMKRNINIKICNCTDGSLLSVGFWFSKTLNLPLFISNILLVLFQFQETCDSKTQWYELFKKDQSLMSDLSQSIHLRIFLGGCEKWII